MTQEVNANIALLLYPTAIWNLFGMELRKLRTMGDVFRQGDCIEAAEDPTLARIIKLCQLVKPATIYHNVGRKAFRTQKKFFDEADQKVRRHVASLTSSRIYEAVELAVKAGVSIYMRPKPHDFIDPDKQLIFIKEPVALHTLYRKTDDGIDYRLTIGDDICPSQHNTLVIANAPSLFCIDRKLMHFDVGLNGNLLRPFVKSEWVHVPARMQSEYLRKMVLKIAAKIDIDAEGFDVEEQYPQYTCHLQMEKTAAGDYTFRIVFEYNGKVFDSESKREKSVTLNDDGDNVTFVCVHRSRGEEQHIIKRLKNELGLPEKESLTGILQWIRKHQEQLDDMGVVVEQPAGKKYYIGDVKLTKSQTRVGDWFQLHTIIHFDDGLALPLLSLRQAILEGKREYKLPNGKWFVIPDEWFARYSQLMLFGLRTNNGGMSVHRSQKRVLDSLGLKDDTTDGGITSDYSLPKELNATLRPYQEVGYRWLLGHMNAATGCCLSDDMGLGKTIQSIAVILKYKETANKSADEEGGKARPVLVIAPASVVYNWRNEIKRFAPTLRVLTYTGSPTQRTQMRKDIDNYDVVVATYATVRNDIDDLCAIDWGINIFDESQLFKNNNSLTYVAIKRLQCKRRIALSGTPMQNNLQELWTLMNVLNPQLLGDRTLFQRNFIKPINENLKSENTAALRKLVEPFFLRRTKAEVLSNLPDRQDEIIYCDMTPEQASLYAVEESRMRNLLMEEKSRTSTVNTLASITRLRQIACTPKLVGKDAPSGKMAEVYERLEELQGTSHKVLIFSEYVSLLDIVAKEMKSRGWDYSMLTGSTSDREGAIDYFQNNEKCQFFLISLKAGGVGLNLTEADYVFLLDPWWNINAEEQAISRAHRSGQRRSVFVYRFITNNSLEEKILHIQDRKQSLINAILSFI